MRIYFILFFFIFNKAVFSSVLYEKNTNKDGIIIENINIVDVINNKILKNYNVLIKENRINKISKDKINKINDNTTIINANSKYLIPGLWDMHVHIINNQDIAMPSFIFNGITSVRDMGTSFEDLSLIKEKQNEKKYMPNIYYSGPILDGEDLPTHLNVSDSQNLNAQIPNYLKNSVDFLKIYTWLKPETYKEIASISSKNNLTFSGHVPINISVIEASNIGQKSIEHLYGIHIASSNLEEQIRKNPPKYTEGIKIFFTDKIASDNKNNMKEKNIFDVFKKNKTYQTPTLIVFQSFLRKKLDERNMYAPKSVNAQWQEFIEFINNTDGGKEIYKNIDILLNRNKKLVFNLHKNGVPILAGSDANLTIDPLPNNYYGFALHDELKLLVDSGLSPIEALKTATINPAEFMNISNIKGSVEENKIADLVILNKNPLADIKNIKNIDSVILNGNYISTKELSEMKKNTQNYISNLK